MKLRNIDEIEVDEKKSFSKTITETDVYLFAGITGDMNPIHINRVYAESTQFHKPIAHGILGLGLISNVLGTQLPGPGAIYLEQTIKFAKPVFIGDTVTAYVQVKERDLEKNRLCLRTWCENQNSAIVMDGEALLVMPREENK